METNNNKKQTYLSILYVFICFYIMVGSGILINLYTDIFVISRLAILEQSWFSIGVTFLFIAVLTGPIRYFIIKHLDEIIEDLFMYKTKEEQKNNVLITSVLAFILSSIILSFTIIYSLFYGFIIENFIEELKHDKIIGFLFFSYITIMMWFSLELLQIEKIAKILFEDMFKIDYFKTKTLIKIENLYMEKYSKTSFRKYSSQSILFTQLLPLKFNDKAVNKSIKSFNEIDKKSRKHTKLSLKKEDIVFEHNLKEESKLVYVSMQFRKTTLSKLDESKIKIVNIIKDEKLHSLFQKNVKEANKYLVSKKQNVIDLHSEFNPLEKITNDNLNTNDVFKSEIKNDNNEYKKLLEHHRKYLMEILTRV